MSGYERTHWRDEALSERHRHWGYNCPGLDIDWFFIEYDVAKPVALVDYKKWNSTSYPPEPDRTDSNVKAFRELAQRAGVPGLIVYYSSNPWAFCVWPLDLAGRKTFQEGETLTEVEWVERLYSLRRRVFSENIINKLSDEPARWHWVPEDVEAL